jgi:dTDP-4-amino-4,6-dideoxygalactose transaminase
MQKANSRKKATVSHGPAEFIPLARPSVGEEELEEIRGVLRSGWLAQGSKVKAFEQKLAERLRSKFAVATSSCTTALSLAIESLELKRGTEMVVPDFTFPATGNVVLLAGSRPVLVDVHADTYGIRPSEVRKAIGNKTSAVIPVHPFGHPFEMDELYELAEKRGIQLIEDAATAFGTEYKGRPVGSSGRAVCLSFHPRKLLTTAEGGCLLTGDRDVYERAIALRSHGQVTDKDGKIEFRYNGFNYRMSDVHAAIGLAQLGKMNSVIHSRREQAKLYKELLSDSGLDVTVPVEKEWAYHTYQSYVIVLGRSISKNEKLSRVMRDRFKVETQVGTYSLAVQPSFQKARRIGPLDTSKNLYERSLTLPLYEHLSEEDQAYIVESLVGASRV